MRDDGTPDWRAFLARALQDLDRDLPAILSAGLPLLAGDARLRSHPIAVADQASRRTRRRFLDCTCGWTTVCAADCPHRGDRVPPPAPPPGVARTILALIGGAAAGVLLGHLVARLLP